MSYDFYRVLHIVFLFCFFLSLGGLWVLYSSNTNLSKGYKKTLMMIHGLSLFIIFVAGFGLIAKLKIPSPWPNWIFIKMTVWFLLGLSPFFLKKGWPMINSRKINSAISLVVLIGLMIVAVMTARFKY